MNTKIKMSATGLNGVTATQSSEHTWYVFDRNQKKIGCIYRPHGDPTAEFLLIDAFERPIDSGNFDDLLETAISTDVLPRRADPSHPLQESGFSLKYWFPHPALDPVTDQYGSSLEKMEAADRLRILRAVIDRILAQEEGLEPAPLAECVAEMHPKYLTPIERALKGQDSAIALALGILNNF